MKKVIVALALFVCLAATASAEGNQHGGGKTCPTGQNCILGQEPEITVIESKESHKPFEIKMLLDFLAEIFN